MALNCTFALKLYASYRKKLLSKLDPATSQQKTLLKLVNQCQDTQFGKDHQFANINSVNDYQKAVPLRKFEDFWSEYWEKPFPIHKNITYPEQINFFAVSSGTTTGKTKYMPQTKALENSNTKAGLDLLVHHYHNYPNSQLLAGKSFFLGGSTVFEELAPNIYSGDLSGVVAKNMAWFIKPFFFPPKELALLSNWEEKIDRFARESLKEDIRLISGVPSWMLIFFNKLFELRPDANRLIQNIYPNLEVIVHGGVNFTPYLKQFQKLIEGSNIQFREVYPASEGFIAIADRGFGDGMLLNLNNDIFYEFVPLSELESNNPTRHWLGNVEKNINYAIILTNPAGMWSYILGDTVKFVDTDTPRILITGRTSYSLSAFGEHLIDEEIQGAVSVAANDINFSVSDYSVGAVYPKSSDDLGGHRYIIEFSEGIPSKAEQERYVQILDRALSEKNEDYEAHRAKGFGLKAPQLTAVSPGFFSNWMKSRGKLGGQNKVPRIIQDQDLFKNLTDFADKSLK